MERPALGHHRDKVDRLWLEGSATVNTAVVIGDKLIIALPVGFRMSNGDQISFASGNGGGVRSVQHQRRYPFPEHRGRRD